ncbi:MAG: hypothetical protein LBJ02_05865 [Bifidobacteriaceae bacterium]|nr:hypothetical protein [Bifidobacteriaceae bacterium]
MSSVLVLRGVGAVGRAPSAAYTSHAGSAIGGAVAALDAAQIAQLARTRTVKGKKTKQPCTSDRVAAGNGNRPGA